MERLVRLKSREEMVKEYREELISKYAWRAFNFKEALAEFDKNPEEFDMVFYSLADVICDKLKDYKEFITETSSKSIFDPINHDSNRYGWLCKPGQYPKIIL